METSYYLRMRVLDRTGVLADITRLLADSEISIDAMVQKEPHAGEDAVDIIMLTHQTVEKRVNAALAFLLRPELLILDEPTAALDPVSSSILKDKIRAERFNGRTFILTSHVLSELEELADRIVFLLDGNVRFAGSTQELLRNTGERKLERAVAAIMRERSPQEEAA